MELVKKITVKGLVPTLDDIGEIKKPVALCRIYGIVRSGRADRTTYGDYIRFSGTFEGVNLMDGTLQHGGTMILPQIAESVLWGSMDQESASAMEFSIEIGIKPSKSPVGYDYTVKLIAESQGADPLAALRAQAKPALPAPAPEPEQALVDSKKK